MPLYAYEWEEPWTAATGIALAVWISVTALYFRCR